MVTQNNAGKKPPISLKPDEVEEVGREQIDRQRRREESQTGRLDWAGSPPNRPNSGQQQKGGGFNWGSSLAGAVIAIAVAAVMIITMAAGKGEVTKVAEDLEVLKGQTAALSDIVTANGQTLDNVVNTMGEYAKKSELGNYASQSDVEGLVGLKAEVDGKVDALQAHVDKAFVGYEERLAALEVEKEEEQEALENETVRWTLRLPDLVDYSGSDLELDIDVDDRIEDEGLYYIDIEIANTSTTVDVPLHTRIRVVMVPRDDALLDENETYFDSDDTPWLDWDADFITKTREGKEVTKRVEFESDKYNFGTIPAGQSRVLELVLELYYDN